MIGQTLGNYRVASRLGAGGMGVVYAGEHTLIGKRAAIKVLLPRHSTDANIVRRFFNEAKAATSIRHPGIVEVFDVGLHHDGSAYIVMESLDGESLSSRLQRTDRMSPEDSVRLLGQIADALGAAHAARIIHRDLKPDNIFLCPDLAVPGGERVKVLDFGIAKLSGDITANGSHTRTGTILGTPRFMAPEQCRGAKVVDHRADLYAMGCIAFAMMCGRPPFLDQGLGDLLAAHMFRPPLAPTSLEPSIPAELEAIIMRLLAKNPAHRFQSAAEVREALERVEQGRSLPGVDAWPIPPRSTTDDMQLAFMPTLDGEPSSAKSATISQRWLRRRRGLAVLIAAAAALLLGSDHVAPTRAARAPSAIPEPEPPRPPPEANRWVHISPPAGRVRLGLSAGTAAREPDAIGLRPEREVYAPRHAYELQQHEVTWGELDPWLAEHAGAQVYRPAWVPSEPGERARWPATGIPWETAYRYCRALGGRLPSEAEWAYAARGAERRPYAWGNERLDRFRTHAYAGEGATVVAVMTRGQDRTPGDAGRALHDMMGNAQEWVADLWRNDQPGEDESWVQSGGAIYRTVRGLPVNRPLPAQLPAEGAAYRDALCASDACIKGYEDFLAYVGFRCARDIHGAR